MKRGTKLSKMNLMEEQLFITRGASKEQFPASISRDGGQCLWHDYPTLSSARRPLSRLLATLGVAVLLAQVSPAATITDNFTDPSNWGTPFAQGGSMSVGNGRMNYTATATLTTDGGAAAVRNTPLLPTTQDWSMQVDVHIDPFTITAQDQFTDVFLGFGKTGDEFNTHVTFEFDRGWWHSGFWDIGDDVRINGVDAPGLFNVNNLTSPDAALRMDYNAANHTITYYSDADGAAGGYNWVAQGTANLASGTYNLNLSASDTFTILLVGSSGYRNVAAGQAYLDNLVITYTPPPVVGAITLLSPVGGLDFSSTQRYTWKADTHAVQYELYVTRNGSLFCDKWFTLSNSVVDSATGNFAVDVSGHSGGSYQWYVRGWGSSGLGPWSRPMNFSLGIPGAVALLTPTNNASLSSRQPALTWSQSFPAATWFQLYVTRNGSTYLDQWIQGATNWTPTADLPAGSYSWWVQTYSSGGLGPWSTNSTFTILSAVPAKMVLVSPRGSMAVNSTQRYTWKTDANATWYELYVTWNGSVFADKWFALSNSVVDSATGNFAVDVGGHVGGSYQYYVRGWSPDGFGAWSDPLGFSLGVAGPVTLLTPTNNASLQERQPRFSWSQSFPTADWFHLYITHNGSPYLDQWVEGATNYTPAMALPWGNYTWGVQTYNSTGLGAWSTNASFTVPRAVPTDITLVSPTGSVAAGSTQRYICKADPAAIWYELYVTRNGSVFADKWFTLSNSVVDSATGNFAVDLSGHGSGTYQWWMRGWSPDGLGPWSAAGNFTLPSLMPGALTLLSPTGNITAVSTVSYSWTADVKAAWYELYVTQNGSLFADKWYAVSNSTAADFTVDLDGHGGGSYQWFVRGWSPDGFGPWSAVGSFSMPIYAPATLVGTTWYMIEDWAAQSGNYRILSLAQTTFGVAERNGHTGSGSYTYSKLGAAEGAIMLYWPGGQKEYIQMFFNTASNGRTIRWYTDETGNWLPGNYLGDFERR